MTRRTRFLHVGLPKTGTSYLQSIMWQSRAALAAHGLGLVPGKRGAPFQLMLAVCDELSAEMDPPRAFTALRRFRQEVAASGWARTLTSQELLGAAEPPRIAALLEALADDETHVIVTVRDLAGFLPSAWQQHVKARGVLPFETYLDEFAASANEVPHPAYDLRGVLDRWSALVPPDRIHIVTVPKRGPERVLLKRFCRVLEVDPTALNTEMATSNTSLGLVQAELLRRVNVELGDRLPHPRAGYREQGKVFLAGTVLSAQRGTVARLPHRMTDWCEQASQAMIARLSVSGFDIVGDLADLVPDASAFTDDGQVASDREIAAAATSALADVLAQRSADAAELEHLRARLRGLRRRTQAQSPPDQPRTS